MDITWCPVWYEHRFVLFYIFGKHLLIHSMYLLIAFGVDSFAPTIIAQSLNFANSPSSEA